MSEKKPVSVAVQVILCLIPLVWIYGFFRIEKLISGILMLIGVVIMAFVIQIFIPFYLGYALAWLVSFLVPIHYIIKWSREWNDNISHYEKKFVKSNNLIPIIGIVVAILFILALVGFNQISQHTETEKTPISVSPQIQTQPTKSEVKAEPVQTEPVQTEPVQTEPVQTEPVQTEPVEAEPVEAESIFGCSGNAECITGMITKIVDGDTIDIDGIRIRISLTNTPERDDEGFSEATQFTTSLCPVGSKAHVDQDDLQPYDKFGRMLGKVTCSGKVLNSELLYKGFANISTQFCSTSEFSSESWAQEYGCTTANQATSQQIPKETPKSTNDPNDCKTSYPDFCIHPSSTDLDCKDVLPHKKFTVNPPDPYGFDGDHDGIGCER